MQILLQCKKNEGGEGAHPQKEENMTWRTEEDRL